MFRRAIGALLAFSVLAALVSPTAASPIVRKAPRVVVDGNVAHAAAPLAHGHTDGRAAGGLWLIDRSAILPAPILSTGARVRQDGGRVATSLGRSTFGSRPPPAQVL